MNIKFTIRQKIDIIRRSFLQIIMFLCIISVLATVLLGCSENQKLNVDDALLIYDTAVEKTQSLGNIQYTYASNLNVVFDIDVQGIIVSMEAQIEENADVQFKTGSIFFERTQKTTYASGVSEMYMNLNYQDGVIYKNDNGSESYKTGTMEELIDDIPKQNLIWFPESNILHDISGTKEDDGTLTILSTIEGEKLSNVLNTRINVAEIVGTDEGVDLNYSDATCEIHIDNGGYVRSLSINIEIKSDNDFLQLDISGSISYQVERSDNPECAA